MRVTANALGQLGMALVHMLYPPLCLHCAGPVASDFGLCGSCWRETPFISGPVCHSCGLPVPETLGITGDTLLTCETCHHAPRPWHSGRAVLRYEGVARQLLLGLKHGDRLELAQPMGVWLARAAAPLLQPGMVLVPIPLHWTRLFARRYNQAALLAQAMSRQTGCAWLPDTLRRIRRTGSQEGRSRAARFAALEAAFEIAPARQWRIRGRPVLLIDDVMTSGATFSHATQACHDAGATEVSVLALARVAPHA